MMQKKQFKNCPVGFRPFTPRGRIIGIAPLKPQGGFTLIEILIAMTIFSTSFLALAAGATTVMKSNHSSYNNTIATNMAQDKLEQLMAGGGAALPVACTAFTVDGCSEPASSGASVTFTRSWEIKPNDTDLGVIGITRINVKIEWTDQNAHSLTLSTAVNP
jgi:prepilin-type N-terminal cleavage/methylation domain-containing protein